jgi:diguanylate cyclase (GGDEF)-like protein/PAS domain S-box-containing protein
VSHERETFVRVSSSLVRDDLGRPSHYALQVADVTELVLAERARHEHETQLRTILEMAEEGIVALDEDRRVVFANRRLAELLGRDVDQVMGLAVEDLLPGLDVLAPEQGDGVDAVRRFESPLLRSDGTSLWVIVSSRSYRWAHSELARFVVMVTDVSELKAAEHELRHRSTHDSLTGLANRSLLDDWAGSNTGTSSQAVIFVDLDGFKTINDTHGHATGDDVLVAVAARLRAQVRSTDLVARLGGDEFVVICRDTEPADAADLAHRIVRALSAPMEVDGGRHQVHASAGLAIGGAEVAHQGLLRQADAALYRAKRSGGDRVAV